MERANGIEPSTLTLARLCSTAELRPQHKIYKWYRRADSNRHALRQKILSLPSLPVPSLRHKHSLEMWMGLYRVKA